jgi:ABC-2 type transport system ATP-binding protein
MQVEWSQENEVVAKVWVPTEQTNISDVLSRVVGVMPIADVKIVETNTDDIVREIYKSGSAKGSMPL